MTTPEERAKEAKKTEEWMRKHPREDRNFNEIIQESFKNENGNTTNNVQNQERGMDKLQDKISKHPKQIS